jgi:hypothetical protein
MTKRRPAPVIDESDSTWHIDRKIPLSLILAICLQTVGAIWLASSFNERLNVIEAKMLVMAPQGDRLTRVEVNLEQIKDSLGEIKAVLRKGPPK